MRISGILKPVLFIYETVRIVLLVITIAYLMPDITGLIWLILSSSAVLFPLMALFLWLDMQRYRVYIPLYMAGKGIGIVTLLIWEFAFRQTAITQGFYNIFYLIELVFLSGDLFALAFMLLIYRSGQKIEEAQENKDNSILLEQLPGQLPGQNSPLPETSAVLRNADLQTSVYKSPDYQSGENTEKADTEDKQCG